MAIEMPCTGCGQKLRVSDEHAGKLARCPQCGTISRVPTGGQSPAETPQVADPSGWPDQPEAKPGAEEPWPENPFAESPYAPSSPFQPSGSAAPRYQRPHRGGAVLTLGIVGVFCCLICGIVAWAMGASDLKEMRAGRMDPSGRGLTQAGMILGIISVAIAGFWLVINLLAAMAGGF